MDSDCALSRGIVEDEQTAEECENDTYVQVQTDWPYYATSEEIVEAATQIYSGTVVDMSYTILNRETGEIVQTVPPEGGSYMLYTVYTVQVEECYKGEHQNQVRLCLMGGTAGVNEQEQYDLLERAGYFRRYDGIPLCIGYRHPARNGKYLFCTIRHGDLDFVISGDQYMYRDGEKIEGITAEEIIEKTA